MRVLVRAMRGLLLRLYDDYATRERRILATKVMLQSMRY